MVVSAGWRRQSGLRLVDSDDGHRLGVARSRWCSWLLVRRRVCRCSPTPRSACSAPARSTGSPRQRAVKVLQFGLIHALIGIPIGVALALSVGGAYFMSVYLRVVRLDRKLQRSDARVDTGAHRLQRVDHHQRRSRRGDRRRRLTTARR